jgi:hypothetical protein
VRTIPGNEDVALHRLRRSETFLEHAPEAMDDGIGDEDGLCKSGEAYLLDHTVGAWPGDGVADGTLGFDLIARRRRDPPPVEDIELDGRAGASLVAP